MERERDEIDSLSGGKSHHSVISLPPFRANRIESATAARLRADKLRHPSGGPNLGCNCDSGVRC